MTDILLYLVVAVYALALLFIFTYSLAQLHLVLRYTRKKDPRSVYKFDDAFRPRVTIQLPLYNERYVVERLIDAVCKINYPKALFEVQLLDDSTDETEELCKIKTNEWQQKGINIVHLRRADRSGYKAGALKYGLEKAQGDFIVVFDADFIPEPDFLEKTIPYFTDEKIGVVQTRWGHINRGYSLLTRLQAFALDAHFTVEQVGRNMGGFINFNGTAGIWRKTTIIDAGNWEADTLTEDLDLSYRAQLKNWKFIYLENVTSPAELPPVMSALKSQQYRWTKGGAEVARKHLGKVFRSRFPFAVRFHGTMHLLNSAVFLAVITCSLLSVPLLFAKAHFPRMNELFWYASLFLLSFLILGSFYYLSAKKHLADHGKNFFHFLAIFPVFLSVSMGLSLHNAIAVLEGYAGKKTPFIRTPKFNILVATDSWKKNKYLPGRINWLTIGEGLLTLYFAFGIYTAFRIADYGLVPFHVMLTFGFGTVFFYSVVQSRRG